MNKAITIAPPSPAVIRLLQAEQELSSARIVLEVLAMRVDEYFNDKSASADGAMRTIRTLLDDYFEDQ